MEPEINQPPVVLVTGSGGLIGSRVCPRLQERYTVVGIDLHPPEEPNEHLDDWYRVDLTEQDSVSQAIAQVKADYGDRLASVIHLAAYYDFSGDPSPLYDELTVNGTRRLIDELQTMHVEQFQFSSSLLVMESVGVGQRLTERSPTNAEWAYPESKLKTERVLQEERGDIPVLVLRIAGVYDEQGHSLPVSHQIQRIYEKQMESYFFPGNEKCGQSFVHLDDLAECIVSAVDRRNQLPPWKTLLIGEEDVMSYAELQEAIGRNLHGQEWPTIRIPAFVAKAGAWVKLRMASSKEDEPFIKPWMVDLADQNYPIDTTEAQQCLGWAPQHTLRKTLPTILDWLKSDPTAFYATNKLGELEPAEGAKG
ncbi:NAD(P)-dependent oxidoreductase [Bremerella sp. JC817]|uniref:NAD-dependent epimerase/dehydratase family protein n=1 Tax=Bremerella sp. JC817 TaxID=3231756 RepID=UPI003457DF1B